MGNWLTVAARAAQSPSVKVDAAATITPYQCPSCNHVWLSESVTSGRHYTGPLMELLRVLPPCLVAQEDDANGVRTILLTGAIEKSQIIEALQLGVRGVVLKSSASDLLFKSIRRVRAGELWIGRETVTDVIGLLCRPLEESFVPPAKDFGLSPREREIVAAIVAGYTNGEIAKSLKIGEQTVKHHLTNIFRKTEVSNRLELALFAINRRLVREEA